MATLSSLFDPRNIALIGASDRDDSVGRIVLANLLSSKNREIFPVNPRTEMLLGHKCYPDIGSVPGHVDVAVIATPVKGVAGLVAECGKAGVDSAVIISSSFKETEAERALVERQISDVRKRYGMRILGPDSLGFVRPNAGLNASFLETSPPPGNIALISQSGALGSAILDWAADASVGFSMFASLGSMTDVGFGDLIDFLGDDWDTRSILVYMERVGDAQKFISAARAFALRKPIIVLKQGKFAGNMDDSLFDMGEAAVEDAVYEAAFKRAGAVRVRGIAELFHAASVLDSRKLPRGPRLAIVTAASREFAHAGPGAMATDALADPGGRLAQFSPETVAALDKILPSYCSKSNPVDVLGTADNTRSMKVIDTCLEDPGVDGVLVVYIPMNMPGSEDVAQTVIESAKKSWKPVVAAWMGGKQVKSARETLLRNDVPTYETPEEAVKTYLTAYRYKRNLELLYETPSELPEQNVPRRTYLKELVRKDVREGRRFLGDRESKEFLLAYGIPSTVPHITRTVEEALGAARAIGYPVAIKIVSPQVSCKSAVGGVIVGISSDDHLREAYARLMTGVKERAPGADVEGITIEKMIQAVDYELALRSRKDRDFRTVIVFGIGGITREIIRDFSVGLPPLNQTLAKRLIEDTKAYGLIHGSAGRTLANQEDLEGILVSFSNLIVDFPEIAEIDIDSLALSGGRIWALGARIALETEPLYYSSRYSHLVIAPYPVSLVTQCTLKDGTEVTLRPIKPEDESLERELLSTLSDETRRTRFQSFFSITHERLVYFCNIDYDRQLAIIAEVTDEGQRKMVGVGRLLVDPDKNVGEFALLVHDAFQGKGLGGKLLRVLMEAAREKGLDRISAEVMSENLNMLSLSAKAGFTKKWLGGGTISVSLALK